jgi:predicted ArsR family transcriptional regulator
MTETQEKVLRAVVGLTKGEGDITAERVASRSRLQLRAARRHLAALVAQGRIVRNFQYVVAKGKKQPIGRYVYAAGPSGVAAAEGR